MKIWMIHSIVSTMRSLNYDRASRYNHTHEKLNRLLIIILCILDGTTAMWMMDTILHPELMYSLLFGIVYGGFSLWFLTKTASRRTPYEKELEKMASESDCSLTLFILLKGMCVNDTSVAHQEDSIWNNYSTQIVSEKGYEPVSNQNSVFAFLPVTERSMDTETTL